MAMSEKKTGFDVLQITGELCTPDTTAVYIDKVDGEGYITECHGTTKPADNDNNYAVGCLFRHTDGGSGTAVYINEGTTTNCTFGALGTGTATAPTNITSVDDANDNAEFYPIIVDGATGSQATETNDGFTFNPSTRVLTLVGIKSTTASSLTIVPLAGQAILLDGTISIDAGVVTGATSITSTAFVGNLTGNASGSSGSCTGNSVTATALETARTIGGTSFNGTANIVPASIVVADTADTTCFVALFEEASGSLLPKTDTGITYNANTGMLTATGLTGPLTGNADTVTSAANDAENKTLYPAFVDGQTGSKSLETDVGLTYNPSTGMLTTAGVTAVLTGNASTATTLETTRAIGGVNFNGSAAITPLQIEPVDCADAAGPFYPLLVDGLTGAQATQTDAGITYNASTNTLTATTFSGALSGAITGSGAGLTANSVKPTALPNVPTDLGAATITVDISNSNGANVTNFVTDGSVTGGSFSGSASGLMAGSVKANALQSAAADLGAANVTIDLGNTNGAFVTNVTTDGTVTAGTLYGFMKPPTPSHFYMESSTTIAVTGLNVVTADAAAAGFSMTGFTGGVAGQLVTLINITGTGVLTMADGANFYLAGDFAMGTTDTITLVCQDGTKWHEVARSNN